MQPFERFAFWYISHANPSLIKVLKFSTSQVLENSTSFQVQDLTSSPGLPHCSDLALALPRHDDRRRHGQVAEDLPLACSYHHLPPWNFYICLHQRFHWNCWLFPKVLCFLFIDEKFCFSEEMV